MRNHKLFDSGGAVTSAGAKFAPPTVANGKVTSVPQPNWRFLGYYSKVRASLGTPRGGSGGPEMEWTTPSFEEISLNCEISSYASAEL